MLVMNEYKEALNRAKELHQSGNALTKLQMEIVFPELKESEDEKIRTRLIALVEAFGHGKHKDEMLSYLEKQKKRKPEIEIYTRTKSKSFMEPYMKGWNDALEATKKEQKPAEWSEEDENYYDTIVRKLQVIGDDSGLTMNQIDFLDKHRPQPHWRPSEDEITAIEVAVKYLCAHTSDEQLRKNVISVIEHLKQL